MYIKNRLNKFKGKSVKKKLLLGMQEEAIRTEYKSWELKGKDQGVIREQSEKKNPRRE